MAPPDASPSDVLGTEPSAVERALPYALTGAGLFVGLGVFAADPLPPGVNDAVAGGCLLVAAGAITYMIVAHSGPGERPPDF